VKVKSTAKKRIRLGLPGRYHQVHPFLINPGVNMEKKKQFSGSGFGPCIQLGPPALGRAYLFNRVPGKEGIVCRKMFQRRPAVFPVAYNNFKGDGDF